MSANITPEAAATRDILFSACPECEGFTINERGGNCGMCRGGGTIDEIITNTLMNPAYQDPLWQVMVKAAADYLKGVSKP